MEIHAIDICVSGTGPGDVATKIRTCLNKDVCYRLSIGEDATTEEMAAFLAVAGPIFGKLWREVEQFAPPITKSDAAHAFYTGWAVYGVLHDAQKALEAVRRIHDRERKRGARSKEELRSAATFAATASQAAQALWESLPMLDEKERVEREKSQQCHLN